MVILLVGLFAAASGLVFWRCESEAPLVSAPEHLLLGTGGAELRVGLEDAGSGLRSARASLRHAGGETELTGRFFPGKIVSGGSERSAELVARIDSEALSLAEGEAFLDVRARDWSWRSWWKGNEVLLTVPVTVDLTAPKVYIESGLTYVRRGGAAAVVYTVSEIAERDGVTVGEAFFPGYPFPGEGSAAEVRAGSGRRFALFAVPRNAPDKVSVRVIGEDGAGNSSFASFPVRVQERVFEDVRINLPADFLDRKIPELAQKLKIPIADGSIQAFQKINTEERERNEARIDSIISDSAVVPLWEGSFKQMRSSAVTSRFAEYRTYYWSGDQVSEAIHYGYDLASTAQAPITAANRGRVLFADELGIYGNCVILDHGLGLSSLYAHLSSIAVDVGDSVEIDQELGRSGATGLAGGDHLHFAILINGHYVDPKEWWDGRWVRDHVEIRMRSEP